MNHDEGYLQHLAHLKYFKNVKDKTPIFYHVLPHLKNPGSSKLDISKFLSIFDWNEVRFLIDECINMEGLSEKPEKSCGNCRRLVQKEDEYNCILCPYCRKYFCWLCGKSLKKEKDNPKLHYDPNKYPKSSCANKLINFEEAKRKKNGLQTEWIVGLEKMFEKADYSKELEELKKFVENDETIKSG